MLQVSEGNCPSRKTASQTTLSVPLSTFVRTWSTCLVPLAFAAIPAGLTGWLLGLCFGKKEFRIFEGTVANQNPSSKWDVARLDSPFCPNLSLALNQPSEFIDAIFSYVVHHKIFTSMYLRSCTYVIPHCKFSSVMWREFLFHCCDL